MKLSRKNIVYLILSGVFITNAIMAEMIGGKLIDVGFAVMSIGILPWPIVFLTTDLINEFYGRQGVHRISIITTGLIIYVFVVLFLAMKIPATSISPVKNDQFVAVFGQSQWIIVGSIIAFLASQALDSILFHWIKNTTGPKMIWLRSTGSTVISQLFDSFIVLGIAFWLPGIMDTQTFIISALTGYGIKLIIAIGLTPIIYLGHYTIDRYLSNDA